MSLARAFTTRRARHSIERNELKSQAEPTSPQRSKTLRLRSSGSIRNKISGPVELTHTTNMLSYNAPNISPHAAKAMALTSPKSLTRISDDESDKISTATSTPPTSPETSYPQDRQSSPEPNHLSCYFTAPKPGSEASSKASTPIEPTAAFPAAAAPSIPQRAPSHTKKPFEGLTRHRSVSRMSEQSSRTVSTKGSFSFSRSSSTSTNTSAASVSSTPSVSHHTKPSFQHSPMATPPITASTPAAAAPSVAPVAPTANAQIHAPPHVPHTAHAAHISHVAHTAHTTHTTHTAHSATSPVSPHAGSLPPISHKKEYSETNPFGHELAQVSELVEELSKDEALRKPASRAGRTRMNPIVEEEERELIRRGYKKFSAEDYITEIQGLVSSYLGEVRPSAAMWI